MIGITVNPGKTAQVAQLIAELGDKLQPEIAEAANRAAGGITTDGKRIIREQFGFPASEAAQFIKVEKAAKKEGATLATGTFASGAMPLFKFRPSPSDVVRGTRPTGGVTVNFGSETAHLPHAFIANLSKGPSVYGRKGKGRFPIKKLYTRSIPQLIQDSKHAGENAQKIQDGMQDRFENRFWQQCNRLLTSEGAR